MGEVVILFEFLLAALAVGLLVLKVIVPALNGRDKAENASKDETEKRNETNV